MTDLFKIVDETGNTIGDTDVLHISSNDIIILKIDTTISLELMRDLSRKLKKTFTENKFLILPKECEIGVLQQEIKTLQNKNSERKVLKE